MKKRIGLWAFAGSGVAVCWAFLAAAFGTRLDFYHWILFRVTFPLSWFGKMAVPLTYYEAILLNAVMYALIGLVSEPFWRRPH
jgi:hypothetical protein